MKIFSVTEIGQFETPVTAEYEAHNHYGVAKLFSNIYSQDLKGDTFGFIRTEPNNTEVWYVIEPFHTGTAMRQFRITEVE